MGDIDQGFRVLKREASEKGLPDWMSLKKLLDWFKECFFGACWPIHASIVAHGQRKHNAEAHSIRHSQVRATQHS